MSMHLVQVKTQYGLAGIPQLGEHYVFFFHGKDADSGKVSMKRLTVETYSYLGR